MCSQERLIKLPEVDGFWVNWWEMNQGDRGMIRSGREGSALDLQVMLYDEPPFYIVSWPTEHNSEQAAAVMRKTTAAFKMSEFICSSYNFGDDTLTEDERGKRLEGATVDEVLMLDHVHLLRGHSEAEDGSSLLWARDFEFEPDRLTGQHMAIFSILPVTTPEFAEIIQETISPEYIDEVDVALAAFDKVYQQHKNFSPAA